MPNHIYIGLGSNLGDRAGNLLLGIRGMIEAGLEVMKISRIYETEPFETSAQPAFLNMVVELRGRNDLEPEELMQQLLNVETSLGRLRKINKGPRTIDLDLLIYGDRVKETDFLNLPHPELHRRRFVMVPFAEIAASLVHPILKRPISEILADLDDDSEVKLWTP